MHKFDHEPDEDDLLPTGLDYDWTQLSVPRSKKLMDNAETFFHQLFVKQNRLLDIPTMVMDGKRVPFDISVANSEQKPIILSVFKTLKQWINWKKGKEHYFKPLRSTICGKGGCGKSFVLQCIVSHCRRMFNDNSVIHTIAPTGIAAFNVGVATLYRFGGIIPNHEQDEISKATKLHLTENLKCSLALLID